MRVWGAVRRRFLPGHDAKLKSRLLQRRADGLAATSELQALGWLEADGEGSVASELERRFDQAMIGIYTTAKRDLGYNATRFLQMITEHGGLGAARLLLGSEAVSEGFTKLWEHRRLDLTVEAHVLRQEFAELFTPSERRPRSCP